MAPDERSDDTDVLVDRHLEHQRTNVADRARHRSALHRWRSAGRCRKGPAAPVEAHLLSNRRVPGLAAGARTGRREGREFWWDWGVGPQAQGWLLLVMVGGGSARLSQTHGLCAPRGAAAALDVHVWKAIASPRSGSPAWPWLPRHRVAGSPGRRPASSAAWASGGPLTNCMTVSRSRLGLAVWLVGTGVRLLRR